MLLYGDMLTCYHENIIGRFDWNKTTFVDVLCLSGYLNATSIFKFESK